MNAVFKVLPVRFRAMNYADVAPVMVIENQCYVFPWSDTIFRDCIRAGYRCRLLELNGRIEAYGILCTGAGEAHILNLCVRIESRRQGLAQRMLEHLFQQARADKVKTIFLEVRASNGSAINLYHASGFCAIGSRKNYYPALGGRENALVMAKELRF